jgi:hypothetical protein
MPKFTTPETVSMEPLVPQIATASSAATIASRSTLLWVLAGTLENLMAYPAATMAFNISAAYILLLIGTCRQ